MEESLCNAMQPEGKDKANLDDNCIRQNTLRTNCKYDYIVTNVLKLNFRTFHCPHLVRIIVL